MTTCRAYGRSSARPALPSTTWTCTPSPTTSHPPSKSFSAYVRNGRAWVATDVVDHPVAYVLVDGLDGVGHVEQVSVHPGHAGQRLGCALIDTAATWAARNELPALTLTTFADVPWNGPYYARLGFRVMAPEEIGDGLRRVREHEAALGLDRWPRVAMYRPVRRSATVGPRDYRWNMVSIIPSWYDAGMSVQMTIRVDDDLATFIDEAVKAGEGSRADVMNRAIRREIRRRAAQRDAQIYSSSAGLDLESDTYAAWAARNASQVWSEFD